MPAIALPEPAHGRFADPALLRRGAVAAHLDHRFPVGRTTDAALHEAGRGAVLHRDQAGRPDQVRLAQAQLGHLLVVALEAEAGPSELGAIESLRHHPAHREAVPDLLQHESREDRENLQPDAVAELVDALEQLRSLELSVVRVRRAHAGLLVFLAGDVGRVRVADVVVAVLADDEPALLRQAVEAEGGEEHVQQARVVAVLHVLHVELPVARQHLAVAAEELGRRLHDAPHLGGDLGPEIRLDRRDPLTHGAEHQPGEDLHPQPARPMAVGPAVGWHPAFAGDASAEGDAGELAFEVVGPVVIDADDLARLAALLQAEQRAAMGAAVLEGMDRAVLVARHHDGHVAQIGGAEGVGARQLRLEAEEGPGIAAEDLRLLLLVQVAIGIDPVRNAREAVARPAALDGAFVGGAFVDVHRASRGACFRRVGEGAERAVPTRLTSRWAGCALPTYSNFTLAALITLFQRSTSSRMKAVASAGVSPTGSAESSARRARTPGSLIAAAMSALILSTIGAGVPGGATTANQAEAAKPGSVSAIVGTSGSEDMRFSLPTAISLSWPLFTSASETPRLSNMMSTSPASRPCRAGADPRYGTWVNFTPAIISNSSEVRCEVVPLPCVAAVVLPGFALA